MNKQKIMYIKSLKKNTDSLQKLYDKGIFTLQEDLSLPEKARDDIKRFQETIKGEKEFLGAVYISILLYEIENNRTNNLLDLERQVRKRAYPTIKGKTSNFKDYFSLHNSMSSIFKHLRGVDCIKQDKTRSGLGSRNKGIWIFDSEKIKEVYALYPCLIKMFMDYFYDDYFYDCQEVELNQQDKRVLVAKKRKMFNYEKKVKDKILELYRR